MTVLGPLMDAREKKQQLMKQRQKVEDEKLSVPVEDQSEGRSC